MGLLEADAQFVGRVLGARLLASWVGIPDAEAINASFANQTPSSMLGGYAEAAVDRLFHALADPTRRDIVGRTRDWLRWFGFRLACTRYAQTEEARTVPGRAGDGLRDGREA